MERDSKKDPVLGLDFGKLLGFRNLVPVAKREDDIREASLEAFVKKGTESCVPA